jgi:hypothetical protein
VGNSGDGEVYLLIALAVAYAPFITAFGAFRGVQGGGVWKFLAFCFCTLAIATGVLVNFVLGMILWLVAWVFAGLTRHFASRSATADATLKALQEQNALLSKSLDKNETKEAERSRPDVSAPSKVSDMIAMMSSKTP